MEYNFKVKLCVCSHSYNEEPEFITVKSKKGFVKYCMELAKEIGENIKLPLKSIYYGTGFGVCNFWRDNDWSDIEYFHLENHTEDEMKELFGNCFKCAKKLYCCSFVLEYGGIAYEITFYKDITEDMEKEA